MIKIVIFTLILLPLSTYASPIGARTVKASPLTDTSLFAKSDGTGKLCSLQAPCSLQMGISKLSAGTTLFLRAGTYKLQKSVVIPTSGTKSFPIMIEAYPGEVAILDGQESTKSILKGIDVVRNGIHIQGKKYVQIRNLEIKNMGARGINILYSSYITVEGCIIHDNYLSGVTIYGGNYSKPYRPYKYGYNTIQDNIIYNNSDATLHTLQKQDGHTYSYERGDNADGISISSGKFNRVIHNTVFANADDGIDLWRSNNSYVGYNLVYDNGRGKGGNGNGIKAGGNRHFDNETDAPNGKLALIEHNIAFKNRRIGFDINSGKKVTYQFNTAWKNGAQGFSSYDDTIVKSNLAYQNGKKTIKRAKHKNNSWQLSSTPRFINTSPQKENFLKLKGVNKRGAYTQDKKMSQNDTKIFLIGDSTVHNKSPGEMGWGSALANYLKEPTNLFNQARSGASSHSYKVSSVSKHDWESTKTLIKNTDITKGAYLLIQFGHNNKDKNYKTFYNDLKTYIQEARVMGLVPVLITPVSRLYKYDNSHKKYPQTIRDLAKDENVLLLDLHAKSRDIFNHYVSHKAIAGKFAYDDHTHFSPSGASIVAGWVKTLACDASQDLCQAFK